MTPSERLTAVIEEAPHGRDWDNESAPAIAEAVLAAVTADPSIVGLKRNPASSTCVQCRGYGSNTRAGRPPLICTPCKGRGYVELWLTPEAATP